MTTNLGIATDFNVFVLNNDSESNVDSEGRVAVGGNAVFNNYSVGSKLPLSKTRADLIVGGNMDISSGTNFSGNSIISTSGMVYKYTMTNNNGVPNQPLRENPINFSKESSFLKKASLTWANLTPNGTSTLNFGELILKGTNTNLNIFSFNGDNVNNSNISLSQLNGINIIAPLTSTILINIRGSNLSFGSFQIFRNGKAATGKIGQLILWNLPNAKTLTPFTTSIKGSLLAPFATYNSGYTNIEGTLIVNNLTGHTEAHNYPFKGNLPDTKINPIDNSPSSGKTPIPVPCEHSQATTDVLSSIALGEKALSHIINAEGEKIQRALSLSLSNKELLEINDSVVKMLDSISKLELVMLSKMKLLKYLC